MESFQNNIEQYWEEVNSQYDITFDEFKRVCITPFKFVKQIISSGVLRNIRLKYLGVFEVSSSRVAFSKKTLEKNYSKGVISEDKYNKKLNILNSYEQDF